MRTDVVLPQWGMGMQEGVIVAWLKQEGDTVVEDEPLVEVETEKTDGTIDAPASGVLAQIIVQPGATARIYEVLAVIAPAGEALDDAPAASPAARPEPAGPAHPPGDPGDPGDPGAAGPVPTGAVLANPVLANPVPAEPRARRAAQELGISLGDVRGSGPDGRVTEQDVRAAAASAAASAATATAAATAAGAAPVARPLAGVRAVIARKMSAAASAPLVTLTREADVTELERRLRELTGPAGVGYTAAAIRAAALALRGHPEVNAHLNGTSIVTYSEVHVGVAVATDDGLVVPVVREADRKAASVISAEVRRLAGRVRAGTATPGEVSGGTFTVTSLGMHGVEAFTPIVNAPEVAILGVGAVRERQVRHDGEAGWRSLLTLSLTFDHRALDGTPAARFLATVAGLLADPVTLLADAADRG